MEAAHSQLSDSDAVHRPQTIFFSYRIDEFGSLVSKHGARVEHFSSPPNLDQLSYSEAEEAIEGWFLHNFTELRELSEGYNDIPAYRHSDVIDSIFGGQIPSEVLSGASHKIARTWHLEWSAKRVQYLEGGSHPATRDLWALYEQMQRQITTVEEQLKEIRQSVAFIGHNSAPFGEDDRRQIEELLQHLKRHPPEVENAGPSLETARTLNAIAKKIGAYVAHQSNLFITEAAKAAGSEVGKLAIRLGIVALLAERLVALSNLILEWLKANGFNLSL